MINNGVQGDHALTRAGEDYLEAIYRLSTEGGSADGSVRSVDVAEQLGVSKASVNKALSMLKETDMVAQNRYGRVTLTEKGRRYAAVVRIGRSGRFSSRTSASSRRSPTRRRASWSTSCPRTRWSGSSPILSDRASTSRANCTASPDM